MITTTLQRSELDLGHQSRAPVKVKKKFTRTQETIELKQLVGGDGAKLQIINRLIDDTGLLNCNSRHYKNSFRILREKCFQLEAAI
jgi:hypothetical protein